MEEQNRVYLREYTLDDLEDTFEYLSDKDVVKFEPYLPMNREEVLDTLKWRIESKCFLAVVLKDTNKLIGNLYFSKEDCESYEIGYVFNKSYQRKGYAKEACQILLEKLFSEDTNRVFAMCNPKNEASWRLLESLGFRREAHILRNVYFFKDENNKPIWHDTFIYGMLSEEFKEKK